MVVEVLSKHDVEAVRRSNAMAPLSRSQVEELLETCDRLLREREALVALVRELPPTFESLRSSLNAVHRILIATERELR